MKQSALEPGLLQTLRVVAILSVILNPVSWRAFSPLFGVERTGASFFAPGLPIILLWLIYLFLPGCQRLMGRAFLPVAFVLYAAPPLFGTNVTLYWLVPPPLREMAALASLLRTWVTIQFLVLFVAWQYGLFWVMLTGIGLSLLDAALFFPYIDVNSAFYSLYSALVVTRLVTVTGAGVGFAWLMKHQREQRAALTEANRKLAQYAAATEQLGISQERNRLARELHDTLAHSLSGVTVQLEAVQALWEVNGEAARQMLDQALQSARSGLIEARRALQSLRASPLDDLGLALALSDLATSVARRTALRLDLDVQNSLKNLTPEVEQCVYRVAQEALANVARHAQAHSVRVAFSGDNGHLTLIVADDGRGFDPATVGQARYGLQGLRERAKIFGGRLEVESQPGHGATVRLVLPTAEVDR